MPKKKLSPPTWDEKGKRWRKVAYCNGMARTFVSKKKGITSAEREILLQINQWKEQIENLSCCGQLTPMSRIQEIYPEFKLDIETRTSKSNYRPLEGRFEHWILPVIGKIPLADINSGTLQKVINLAYKKGNLSKKSLMNIRADLSAFFKFCRKNGLTTYVLEDIDIPRAAETRQKSIIQPEHLKTLFSVDTTLCYGKRVPEPYINGFRLQIMHILRPGEVGGLKKSDRVGNIVYLRRSINVNQEITHGKNENAVRSFALSPTSQKIWDEQCAASDSEWMFPGYTEKIYYHHLRKYCLSNDIPHVSPYELRHTAFSIAQALPEGLVKQMAGHSKNMDTFGVYGHQVDGDHFLASDLMENRLKELLER